MDFTLPLISSISDRSIDYSGVNLQPDDTTNVTFTPVLKSSAGALGTVTAFTGAIPRIETAEANSSYNTTFFGPVLECSTKQVKTNHVYCSGGYELSYIAFLAFPQDGGLSFRKCFDLNASLPIETSSNTTTIDCASIANFRTSTFGVYPPELFVVARTSIPDAAPDGIDPRQEWKATACQLRNATYGVHVETISKDQVVTVETRDPATIGLTTDYIPSNQTLLRGPSENRIYNYFAMMALMAQTVVGTYNTASDATRRTYTDGGSVDTSSAPFPDIFSIRLSSSPEIQAFAKWQKDSPRISDSPFAAASEGAPLARQTEQLFRSMTAAMLTNPATSSHATVPVLYWNSVNVYRYTAWHLWLAYGIGLIAAASILVLGFAAIAFNGAPYSTRFSTYLRTTPWSSIAELLGGDRDAGADPLPRDTARSMVMLRDGLAVSNKEEMVVKQSSAEQFKKQSGSLNRVN